MTIKESNSSAREDDARKGIQGMKGRTTWYHRTTSAELNNLAKTNNDYKDMRGGLIFISKTANSRDAISTFEKPIPVLINPNWAEWNTLKRSNFNYTTKVNNSKFGNYQLKMNVKVFNLGTHYPRIKLTASIVGHNEQGKIERLAELEIPETAEYQIKVTTGDITSLFTKSFAWKDRNKVTQEMTFDKITKK
jgi:hypothetical protein